MANVLASRSIAVLSLNIQIFQSFISQNCNPGRDLALLDIWTDAPSPNLVKVLF